MFKHQFKQNQNKIKEIKQKLKKSTAHQKKISMSIFTENVTQHMNG